MAGLKLVAELGGDGSGYDAMMRRANATKDKFAGAFAGLKGVIAGAFTIGAITNLSRKTLDYAGHLRDVSDALAVNVEWFQKRANAAKLSGGSEDDLFKFLDTMNKSREEAFNKPGGEQSQRMGRLGFSESDIANLNTMDFFDRIVKAYGKGADAQTTVDVEKVGGKSARHLLAAFSTGMEENGSIMSEDLVNQLDEIGDEFTILGNELMVGFAPALLIVAKTIRWVANQIKQTIAFLGSLYSNLTTSEILFGGAGAGKKVRANMKAARQAAVTEEAEQNNRADELKAELEKARQFRRNREQSGPGFEPLDLTPDKAAKKARGPGLSTDALVGVGNFLGRNPAMVNGVANQQLRVAQDQLITLKQMLEAFKLRGAPAAAVASINVP